jgi:Zn-dependent protease
MRFSLFGIPVHVQPIFWLVGLMLGAPRGTSPREIAGLAIWMVVLFVSILAHELGHAFAMRAYGRAPHIELWGLGGLTHWGEGPPVTPARDIVVSLAGPAAGLALGAIVFGVSRAVPMEPGSLGAELVRQALWINVAWGLVNLAPILPLDGGHVLESSAAWLAGPRGRRIAAGVSLLLAIGVIVWAVSRRQLWIGFLGLWCAAISWKKWSAPENTAAGPAAPAPDWALAGVREVWALMMNGRADEAVKRALALLDDVPEGNEHVAARAELLEALAWARIEAGDDQGALEAARKIPGQPSDVLQGRLLISEGRVEDGIRRLQEVLDRGRNSMPALVLSSVYISEERPDMVLRLLESERGARLSPETHLMLTAQLFHADRFELALAACQLGFERFGRPAFAYNAACSLARLGRVDEGLDWLGRALRAGFDDLEALEQDPDLAALRGDPRFVEIRALSSPSGR